MLNGGAFRCLIGVYNCILLKSNIKTFYIPIIPQVGKYKHKQIFAIER